jgi:hypothetical protein
MVTPPQRTALSGPTLIRLLARLMDADVAESRKPLSERLIEWFGWTDAIALSTALSGNGPARARAQASAPAGAPGQAEADECARVRTSLGEAIAADSAFAQAKRRPGTQAAPSVAGAHADMDYAFFRQRYQSMQQSMETAIGALRGRLRAALAARSPEANRLAVLDAVMERVLSVREHNLLATVPGLLAGHFARLRESEQQLIEAAQSAGQGATVTPGAWLNAFREDMRCVLLAELEVRLQPVEGLLAALRTR